MSSSRNSGFPHSNKKTNFTSLEHHNNYISGKNIGVLTDKADQTPTKEEDDIKPIKYQIKLTENELSMLSQTSIDEVERQRIVYQILKSQLKKNITEQEKKTALYSSMEAPKPS